MSQTYTTPKCLIIEMPGFKDILTTSLALSQDENYNGDEWLWDYS